MSAFAVGTAGYVVARAGLQIAAQTALSDTAVGGIFTAVATSLPELVTAVAAARSGAVTLAVGGVIGGNAFDTLFLAFSDLCYTRGSIYDAVVGPAHLLIAVTIVMTGALLMGLLRRKRRAIANIGFEGVIILALYAGSLVYLFRS